jgi:hypothetical protein
VERIKDVTIKGAEGDEKIFVDIERTIDLVQRLGIAREDQAVRGHRGTQNLSTLDRDWGPPAIVEHKLLCFMKPKDTREHGIQEERVIRRE